MDKLPNILLIDWMPMMMVIGASSAYITYYFMKVVNVPIVACGNPQLKRFLQRHVPALHQPYRPPFWCFQTHVHTILSVPARMFIKVKYRKEIIQTPDGGEICLDWVDADDTSDVSRDRRPTVILLPGLTGSSDAKYIQHFADDACRRGYRSVVFNQRGFGGAILRTPRVFCAANSEDFRFVINHIKTQYPDAPLVAAGMSIGGIILMNYLAEYGSLARLEGALSISAAWDMHKSTKSIEDPVNWFLFNNFLTRHLTSNVKRNIHMFEKHYDVNWILQSKTIKEFDERMTAKMFGYESADQYYSDATLIDKLDRVQVPTLCLNAADDPFAPLETLPLDAANKSSSVALIVTSHGGHLGFMEGVFPVRKSLMDRVLSEFLAGIFEHSKEL